MGCTGYASYKIHGNGTVEVNGQIPSFLHQRNEVQKLQRVWERHGLAAQVAAERHKIHPAWVLGILMQESGGDVAACSPCSACNIRYCEEHLGRSCCAFGVMQFTGETARAMQSSPARMLQDPVHAVERGAALLRRNLDRTGGDLVKAAALYNSGRLQCGADNTFGYVTNSDYPYQVIKWANTASQLNLVARSYAGALSAFVVVLVTGLVSTGTWKPKFS